MGQNQFLEYWDNNFPWSFKGEKKTSFEEKRRMRYQLQDYMNDVIGFENYRDKLVLEIGCGAGIDSAEFARNGAKVVSLDFTKEGTRTTLETIKEARVSPNVVRASAEHLPFRPGSFDCVYSFGVLHHIPKISAVIEQIARILKPMGDFTCMLYNKESLLYAYSILFLHREEGSSETELLSRYSERNLGCPYTRAYTKEEARHLLDHDFEGVDAKVCFNVIDTPNVRKLKIRIDSTGDLGWHLILKGKRKST